MHTRLFYSEIVSPFSAAHDHGNMQTRDNSPVTSSSMRYLGDNGSILTLIIDTSCMAPCTIASNFAAQS